MGFFAQRKAHPPLGARAEVYHGVEVVVTGKQVNTTAPSGWMMRLVLHLFVVYSVMRGLIW
jgi:hypothetical protein